MLNKKAAPPRPKLKATSKHKPLTKEEKELVKAKKQQRSARVRLNIAQRKIANIARSTEDNDIAEKATESLPETYSVQEEPSQTVLFEPNPGPQHCNAEGVLTGSNLPEGQTLLEVINVTSMTGAEHALRMRDAHIIAIQEHKMSVADAQGKQATFARL